MHWCNSAQPATAVARPRDKGTLPPGHAASSQALLTTNGLLAMARMFRSFFTLCTMFLRMRSTLRITLTAYRSPVARLPVAEVGGGKGWRVEAGTAAVTCSTARLRALGSGQLLAFTTAWVARAH